MIQNFDHECALWENVSLEVTTLNFLLNNLLIYLAILFLDILHFRLCFYFVLIHPRLLSRTFLHDCMQYLYYLGKGKLISVLELIFELFVLKNAGKSNKLLIKLFLNLREQFLQPKISIVTSFITLQYNHKMICMSDCTIHVLIFSRKQLLASISILF